MDEIAAARPSARCPSHPGALLADILPATGRSAEDIAALIGLPLRHLDEIMAERTAISPEVAAKLGKLFGDGAAVWLRMQAAYDAWHAEREVDVSAIPTIRAA